MTNEQAFVENLKELIDRHQLSNIHTISLYDSEVVLIFEESVIEIEYDTKGCIIDKEE